MTQPPDRARRPDRSRPRDRHLLDPAQLRRDYERAVRADWERRRSGASVPERPSGEGTAYASDRRDGGGMSLGQVQRWVMAALAVTTLLHLAAGVALAGVFADDTDARIGLTVIAGLVGVGAVASGLLIHGRSLLSPWLLLGVLPGVAGAWLAFA